MNAAMLSTEHLALGALIVFFASVVRGFSGFGSALVAIPLLAFFIDLKLAIVLISIQAVINGIILAFRVRDKCELQEMTRLGIGHVPGLGIGIFALLFLKAATLKRVFGVFVVLFALRLLSRPLDADGKRWPKAAAWPAGVLSGMTAGAFGAAGPPVIIYLAHRLGDRHVMRATTIVFFLACDSLRIFTYLNAGVITPVVLQGTLWFAPASIIGSLVGARLQVNVNETLFRRIICTLLIATGGLFAAGR